MSEKKLSNCIFGDSNRNLFQSCQITVANFLTEKNKQACWLNYFWNVFYFTIGIPWLCSLNYFAHLLPFFLVDSNNEIKDFLKLRGKIK